MINIRAGVFETNSSSVHSMVICDSNDYIDWVKGKKLFNSFYSPTNNTLPAFVTPEEAAKYDSHYPYPKEYEDYFGGLTLEFKDENGEYHDRQFITLEEYQDTFGSEFYTFTETHVTPSGDEIIAFGYHGFNG